MEHFPSSPTPTNFSCSPSHVKNHSFVYMLFSTQNTFTITPLPRPPSASEDSRGFEYVQKSLVIDKKTLKMMENGK